MVSNIEVINNVDDELVVQVEEEHNAGFGDAGFDAAEAKSDEGAVEQCPKPCDDDKDVCNYDEEEPMDGCSPRNDALDRKQSIR